MSLARGVVLGDSVSFDVRGDPKTKGSGKIVKRGKRYRVVNDCDREKAWAQAVHAAARAAAAKQAPGAPWTGPVFVFIQFFLPRPQKIGKKRTYVPSIVRPDSDKLGRSVMDALTGVIYNDDGQVSGHTILKHYADFGESSGAYIRVYRMEEP